jgi:hypothetical protein
MTQSQLAEDLLPIVDEMVRLFPVDEPQRAKVARHLYSTVLEHPQQIAETYCSLDWWGGSGSMADYDLADRRAKRRFLQLLVNVVEIFEKAGYRCPRARSWVDIFSEWLRSGVV